MSRDHRVGSSFPTSSRPHVKVSLGKTLTISCSSAVGIHKSVSFYLLVSQIHVEGCVKKFNMLVTFEMETDDPLWGILTKNS